MIKHPMDFATVRNKLRIGSYATFEEFEVSAVSLCTLLCPRIMLPKHIPYSFVLFFGGVVVVVVRIGVVRCSSF